MDAAREIELKLELDPKGAARFRARAARALGAAGETRQLTSVYFDTPKRRLGRKGYALRIRHDGERRVQTLKAENRAGAGAYDRPEWEAEIAGDAPQRDAFAGSKGGDLLASVGRLAPVFITRVERTAWSLEEGGSTIEVALDEGLISAGRATATIAEVELELKRGSPDDLFRLARRLAALGRLRLAVRSKSERGYALLQEPGSRAAGLKAEPFRLPDGADAGQAFQAIARACVRHLRLNEAGVVEHRAVESLHQARVALRRLRSALSVFRDVVADTEVEGIARELRAVSRLLGEARNLDVYAARLADPRSAPGAIDEGVAERLRVARERAYDRVVRRLEARRFRLFTLDLAAWIETGPWLRQDGSAEVRGRPVDAFAEAVLDRRWRKLRKRGRHLERLDTDTRHQVRIDGKKLRYACEFFAEASPRDRRAKRRRAFLAALERLQSGLGDLNDIAAGAEMDARFGVVRPAESASAEPRILADAVAAHRLIADAKPYWR